MYPRILICCIEKTSGNTELSYSDRAEKLDLHYFPPPKIQKLCEIMEVLIIAVMPITSHYIVIKLPVSYSLMLNTFLLEKIRKLLILARKFPRRKIWNPRV